MTGIMQRYMVRSMMALFCAAANGVDFPRSFGRLIGRAWCRNDEERIQPSRYPQHAEKIKAAMVRLCRSLGWGNVDHIELPRGNYRVIRQ